METGDITIPGTTFEGERQNEPAESVEQLVAELTAFEYETTESGTIKYHAPSGMNDDTVDALALAAQKTTTRSATW